MSGVVEKGQEQILGVRLRRSIFSEFKTAGGLKVLGKIVSKLLEHKETETNSKSLYHSSYLSLCGFFFFFISLSDSLNSHSFISLCTCLVNIIR